MTVIVDLAHNHRRGSHLHERGERRVQAGLDEVDDAEQQDRPVAQLEHVSNLDWGRDVGDAEVVARAAVNADGDSDHGRHGDSRVIVGLLTTSRIA